MPRAAGDRWRALLEISQRDGSDCATEALPMRRLPPLVLSLLLTGCAVSSLFISYPAQMAQVRQALSGDQPLTQLAALEDKIDSKDGLLYAQEAGRVAQIGGDFQASRRYFQAAIDAYGRFDDKAYVSASDLGATAGSLLLNDNAIPYRGPGYERILVHQYQALNYLMQGDQEGALVEVRRANELQAREQSRYEQSKAGVKAMANGTVDAEISRLGQEAGEVNSSFLNAYSYYVTGLLHELFGESNDAFIDYRKAAQVFPGNPYVGQDLVRLAKQLAMPQYQEFKARFGNAPSAGREDGELLLLMEQGLVPEKQALTVPFTIAGNWQTISLPTYGHRALPPTIAEVEGLGTPLIPAPIADIGALAINALKEQLPLLLVRQAARVYAKAELAQGVSSQGKRLNNDFDGAAVAAQVFNVLSEQADRRSWLTLPSRVLIARRFAPKGQYRLSLGQQSYDIQITAGQTTLVWAIDTGSNIRFYSINITRKWN